MNLNSTNHTNVFSTDWFTDPKHPLIQSKILYANTGDVMYYITLHRGPTTDDIEMSPNEVKAVNLNDTIGYEADEQEAMNKLIKAIEKKA